MPRSYEVKMNHSKPKPKARRGQKKQGYNARLDESLASVYLLWIRATRRRRRCLKKNNCIMYSITSI